MKPVFANLDIDFWVYLGRLRIAQPSLCLFHDSIEIGSKILDALNELKDNALPAQRTLTLVKRSRKQSLSNLRLMAVLKREDLQVMSIRHNSNRATIEMTVEGLKLVIEACSAWLGGAEDFGVSPRRSTINPKNFGKLDREVGELWFWGPGYAGP